jgi:hypothetical protein
LTSGSEVLLINAFSMIQKCPKLETLALRYFLTLNDMQRVVKLITANPSLKNLSLKQSFFNLNVADILVALQKQAHGLESLNLSSCDLSSNVCDFQLLTINKPALVSPVALDEDGNLAAMTTCPLKSLNLSCNVQLRCPLVKDIVGLFPYLEDVNLSGCIYVSDEAVQFIAQHCGPRLKHLNLIATSISSASLRALATYCPNLISLRCGSAQYPVGGAFQHIDDQGVATLQACTKLEVFSLNGFLMVGDKGMDPVLRNCRKLRELDLSMTNVSEKSISLLRQYQSSTLEKLVLVGCAEIKLPSFTMKSPSQERWPTFADRLFVDHMLELVLRCKLLREVDCSMVPHFENSILFRYLSIFGLVCNPEMPKEITSPVMYCLVMRYREIKRIKQILAPASFLSAKI